MSESIASEIWGELKRYVNAVDRSDAAETVVAILIDNDCSAEDIADAFKGDSDIKRALSSYINDDKEEYEEESEDEEDYKDFEDEDWEN